jgi:hypothetical protein
MNKLTIVHTALINPHWLSLRFQGDDSAFRSMTALLSRQRDHNAYWCDSADDWIVRIAWIEQYKRRFVNFDRALVVGQRLVATETLKK